MNIKKCPKCGHEREPDTEVPDYECPACGIIYAKFLQAVASPSVGENRRPKGSASRSESSSSDANLSSWIKQRPSQIAVTLICITLGLLVAVWVGDQRSAPTQAISATSGGVVAPDVGKFSQPSRQSEDQLRDAISASNERVAQLQAEYDKYSGGLIRALLGSALAAEKHTFSMLNQKQESWIHRIALDYKVDGTAYIAPQNSEEKISEIEAEIQTAKAKLIDTQAEADRYSGGLIRATLLSAVATQKMSLAMLEQKRASLKFGFPLYSVNAGASAEQSASLDASPAKRELNWSIAKIESRVTESNSSWHKHAWRLELQNDEDIPLTFNAKIEFQDREGFVIDDDSEYGLYVPPNSTKTFTGSTLISVPGAFKVEKTNAKVGLK
jgi:hypothetical protein